MDTMTAAAAVYRLQQRRRGEWFDVGTFASGDEAMAAWDSDHRYTFMRVLEYPNGLNVGSNSDGNLHYRTSQQAFSRRFAENSRQLRDDGMSDKAAMI